MQVIMIMIIDEGYIKDDRISILILRSKILIINPVFFKRMKIFKSDIL